MELVKIKTYHSNVPAYIFSIDGKLCAASD